MMMVVKSSYFTFVLLSLVIVSLRAKPPGRTASTSNLRFINPHATNGGARIPAPGLHVIPRKHSLVNPGLRKALSSIRRNVVVSTNSSRPINGESNSFFDESYNNSGWNRKPEEIELYVLGIQNEDISEEPKINPAYSELESEKCYLIFRKFEEDASKFYGFSFNIIYWIGKDSTARDAATAAYGAVIVDSQVHDRVQVSREVEGHESPHFRALFGGYDVDFEAKIKALEKSDVSLMSTTRDNKNHELKIGIIRIFSNDGVDKCGSERIGEPNVTIADFNHNDCYLIDSGVQELGIFIWIGRNTRSRLDVREETVKLAELYLRTTPGYNFTTPVTFVDANEVPQFWSVEEMINFLSDNLYY